MEIQIWLMSGATDGHRLGLNERGSYRAIIYDCIPASRAMRGKFCVLQFLPRSPSAKSAVNIIIVRMIK
jgi:hypothetical protein